MTMKIMSAREAKNSFGVFLDTVQREPVVVTKRDRPVGVMFAMNDFSALSEFVDSMKLKINKGILQGLEESKTGQGQALNAEYIEQLKSKLQSRINSNPSE